MMARVPSRRILSPVSEPRPYPVPVDPDGRVDSMVHGAPGPPMIRHLAHLAPAGVLAVAVLWTPWPFGSVVPWATALAAAAGPVALAAGLLAGARLRHLRPTAVPAAALLALALLGAAQSLSWPAGLAGALSPEHARLTERAGVALDPSPRSAGAAGEEVKAGGGRVPLSVAPSVSRGTALLMACLAAALLAAALAGRHRLGRRVLGASVLAVALAQILYGAPRWFARSLTLWGVPIPGSDRLRGTFVNPNHFALLLEMALAVALAWGWWALVRSARTTSVERRIALVAPPVLVWLTLFVALAMSGSRAGLSAAAVATGVQGFCLALAPAGGSSRRRSRLLARGAVVTASVLALGVVAVLGTGGSAGFARFGRTSVHDLAALDRIDATRSALELWRDFPWTGTGLGTFLEAFPLVQPEAVELTWWHLHSDPLEVLVTGGVVGALLLLVGVAAVALGLVARLRRVERCEEQATVAAGVGTLVAVGLHELVDFGLTMPANALLCAVILGTALAARAPRVRSG